MTAEQLDRKEKETDGIREKGRSKRGGGGGGGGWGEMGVVEKERDRWNKRGCKK